MKSVHPCLPPAGGEELAEALSGLMADLEDIRDDAQDQLETEENEALRKAIDSMDQALRCLSEAADLLDPGEA